MKNVFTFIILIIFFSCAGNNLPSKKKLIFISYIKNKIYFKSPNKIIDKKTYNKDLILKNINFTGFSNTLKLLKNKFYNFKTSEYKLIHGIKSSKEKIDYNFFKHLKKFIPKKKGYVVYKYYSPINFIIPANSYLDLQIFSNSLIRAKENSVFYINNASETVIIKNKHLKVTIFSGKILFNLGNFNKNDHFSININNNVFYGNKFKGVFYVNGDNIKLYVFSGHVFLRNNKKIHKIIKGYYTIINNFGFYEKIIPSSKYILLNEVNYINKVNLIKIEEKERIKYHLKYLKLIEKDFNKRHYLSSIKKLKIYLNQYPYLKYKEEIYYKLAQIYHFHIKDYRSALYYYKNAYYMNNNFISSESGYGIIQIYRILKNKKQLRYYMLDLFKRYPGSHAGKLIREKL